MYNKLLLPNKYKTIGWCILIPSAILGIILMVTGLGDTLVLKTKVFAIMDNELFKDSHYFSVIEANITATLVGVLFIVGALMVGFSKEKTEDEFIANMRLSSLMWAVLVNYGLMLLAFAFIYGMAFLNVMEYNIFTVLVIFIMRFNYLLYKNGRAATDDK
ncbi:MAG: hypothetical protein JWO06_2109 [Bacteroidota bacterium]|nr:hypothetical protein [Bacteroidota bacterium]